MTVDELLDKLSRAFPAFNARALEAWAPVFRATCEKHEGPKLRDAFTAVLSSFTVAKSKALHPVPADFAAHLPSFGLRLIQGAGSRPLDMKNHGDKVRRIMAEWRLAQGNRGAGGASEVMRALEFIAEPLAGLKARRDDMEPLRLTKAQLKLAQQRAISQQRRGEHGPPSRDPDVWWSQIDAIARGWGIETTLEEWTSAAPQKQAAAE